MTEMEVRYARINFEIPVTDCNETAIHSWIEVLEGAVNWGYAHDYKLFFNQVHRIVGVSIPVKNEAIDLLQVGSVLGIVKIEVVLNNLIFDNLWLSLQDEDTDVFGMT
jgi:hypothetical protein